MIEFWQYVSTDKVLAGTITDHFLKTLSSSCLYEPQDNGGDRQHIATAQPLAIFCALHEMLPGRELNTVWKSQTKKQTINISYERLLIF